jgi:hypothetical protein
MAVPLEEKSGERSRIIAAAERLVATRGIEVTATDVALEAGLNDETVLLEEFGSLELLLEAVWYLHSAPVNLERATMMSRLPMPERRSTRQFVDAWLRPILSEIRRHSPSYWARFNEQYLIKSPLLFNRDMEDELSELGGAHPLHVLAVLYRDTERHLQRIEPAFTPQRAALRVSLAFRAGMHWLAVWEREAGDADQPTPGFGPFAEEIAELLVQMLEVPAALQPSFLD